MEKISIVLIIFFCVVAVVFLIYIFTKGIEKLPEKPQKQAKPSPGATPFKPKPVKPVKQFPKMPESSLSTIEEGTLPGSIKGMVVDAKGRPLSDVLVECYLLERGRPRQINRRALTNRDGVFEIRELPPAKGVYLLTVIKQGYAVETVGGVDVMEGQVTKLAKAVTLVRGTGLEFLVRDEDGRLIHGAKITISKATFKHPGIRFYVKISELYTDESGKAVLSNLSDGSYYAKTQKDGFATTHHSFNIRGGKPKPASIIVSLRRQE